MILKTIWVPEPLLNYTFKTIIHVHVHVYMYKKTSEDRLPHIFIILIQVRYSQKETPVLFSWEFSCNQLAHRESIACNWL